MMTITLNISPEAEARLKLKAAAAGINVEAYASQHLELFASAPKSLQEISGPIGQEFADSRMSEDELAQFLEDEKHAARAGRRGDRVG